MRRRALWIALAAALFAAPAGAEPDFGEPIPAEPKTHDRDGTYLGLSGVYALEHFDDFESDVDNSFGLNVYVGQRFHPHFSVEAEWEWLNEFDVSPFYVDGHFLSLNAKAYVLRGPVQPFLKGGIGFASFTAPFLFEDFVVFREEDDFASRWGGGVDVYATKSLVLSLTAEYVIGVSGLDFLRYTSLGWGLQYRF